MQLKFIWNMGWGETINWFFSQSPFFLKLFINYLLIKLSPFHCLGVLPLMQLNISSDRFLSSLFCPLIFIFILDLNPLSLIIIAL